MFVPLESAFYRISASGKTTAFTAAALLRGSSPRYLKALKDYVLSCIVPGAVSTRRMHDAQRLDTLLPGTSLEVKLESPGDFSGNVLILSAYDKQHALVVRKDVPLCGGGFLQVVDTVMLPHAM